ncbi:hypothetical protein GUJ93_ZPchr0007g3236 [Zizania palustris]|uniref:Uncharacterized protein n=1 Tax=Zizania palustris TaxID=103762 RepID=A0A8J5W600_ZIZPA|nr:hypothetical protein GUJ93_ZPchr0007g3236 [Zizania palustris]
MAEACGDDRWKLSTSKGRSKSGRYTSDSNAAGSSSSSAASLSRSYSASVTSSNRNSGITGCSHSQQSNSRLSNKCVEAVKEHRTRFYIVRRCVSMLVCWRDH